MPHARSRHSKCAPARGLGSRCPKRAGKGQTLADLIHEYKDETADRQWSHHDQYRNFSSLTEAIELATGSVGKVPDHQRRIGRVVLRTACKQLLRHKHELTACGSFADLIGFVQRHTARIRRFGKLAIYDTAYRLGISLKLSPEVVYLHAGTATGATALGLNTSRGYLEMDDLPSPFRLLEPWECEDFLCIYKARLKTQHER